MPRINRRTVTFAISGARNTIVVHSAKKIAITWYHFLKKKGHLVMDVPMVDTSPVLDGALKRFWGREELKKHGI